MISGGAGGLSLHRWREGLRLPKRKPVGGNLQVSAQEDTAHEWRTSTRWHPERRIHSRLGWRTPILGRERAALRGLGDLSRQGLASGSEPSVRVAEQRLVRSAHP